MNSIQINQITSEELRHIISEEVSATAKVLIAQLRKEIEQNSNSERFVSVKELAEHFGKSQMTIYDWKKKNLIPYHSISNKIFFKISEVENAMNRGGLK